MKRANPSFDRLARWYRPLETLAFGRDLERARFAHLGRLAACRSILLLGEGDGRCVERVAALVPQAMIECVDASPGMIERAGRRVAATPAAGRIRFTRSDIFAFRPQPGAYDAVCTLFFLDCFDAEGVASVIARVAPGLAPGALWLHADFVMPESGYDRLRARAWLALLYAFFRWETGLAVHSLPPSETLLGEAGWSRVDTLSLQRGLVRSSVFVRGSKGTY